MGFSSTQLQSGNIVRLYVILFSASCQETHGADAASINCRMAEISLDGRRRIAPGVKGQTVWKYENWC